MYVYILIMVLIGLLAKKYHGKDTAADYLVENHGFVKLSFAKPLKDICRILFGFSDEQLYGSLKEEIDSYWQMSPRTVFQYVGTDMFRKQFNEKFWIMCLKRKYMAIIEANPNADVVISDVRFQNELNLVHELGGIVIKLYRPCVISNDEHISEKNIDTIMGYDKYVKNEKDKKYLYKEMDRIYMSMRERNK